MKSNGVGNAMSAFAMLSGGIEAAGGAGTGQEFDLMLTQKTIISPMGTEDLVSGAPEYTRDFHPQQSYEKEVGESGYKEIEKADNPAPKERAEQLKQAYGELKDEVKKTVSEELGISEEELEAAMEQLGITFENLLNGDGLKTLMMELTGTQDAMELLFSDAFQALSGQLEQLVAEFTEQNALTTEEWQLVLEQLEQLEQQPMTEPEFMVDTEIADVPVESPEITEAAETAETAETVSKAPAETIRDAQVQTSQVQTAAGEEMAEAPIILETEEETGSSLSQEQQNMAAKEDTPDLEDGTELRDDFARDYAVQEEKRTSDHEHPQQTTFQQTQITMNSLGEEVVQTVERPIIDVQDIISQITQYTKVTVEQTQSSIEMQLNPAHLGKIYLQVMSRDGIITAQLAAQNEAVKQALESQAAALRENMSQQGLKVEAVEVTIASHEFEQNLENQRQQAEAEAEADRQKNGGSRRSLNLENLDEISDTLTEEESLMAQIMLDNGNTMDMTA